MTLLQCTNLTRRFGELVAVNNISFKVGRGEIFGVAGPNGAGKTTLFNLICGYLKVNEGKIFFDGKDITKKPVHVRCHLGIARTFQIPEVFASLPIFLNVAVGAHFRRDLKRISLSFDSKTIKKAEDILEFTGLIKKKDMIAKNLSLLDKKLLMLSSALATEPKLLLLDEPTSGLNPKEIEELMRLIKRINEEFSVTIILIEHIMKTLMGLSDKVMIMHHGKKIAEGTPKEVSNNKEVIEIYLGERYV